MSDTFDDASTTIDYTSFLGHYLEAQIAKVAAHMETETPATYFSTCKAFGYPDLDKLKERLHEDDYIILDDDVCMELTKCAESDPGVVKKLLEKHSINNKILLILNFLRLLYASMILIMIYLLIFHLY